MAIKPSYNLKESGYPVIKRHKTSGQVVLFVEKDCGTLLSSSASILTDRGVGEYRDDWEEDNFIPDVQKITLTQD